MFSLHIKFFNLLSLLLYHIKRIVLLLDLWLILRLGSKCGLLVKLLVRWCWNYLGIRWINNRIHKHSSSAFTSSSSWNIKDICFIFNLIVYFGFRIIDFFKLWINHISYLFFNCWIKHLLVVLSHFSIRL